ncbi:hypothetical protein [Aureispira anguillae]|uniref:Uncharacterized protein n=1 Tax=Aureispira anguillae TaxID=2864201 RepID=A0A915YD81_9BACT|nr:hypothetical protein [Aureispira anguillae]BDS10573.1 hypothetical protein AsAng_0012810 [Aureispira anguillae]BDS10870.1 hypothetical protein AsAng_0015800 [Aureispira anguillae]BDS10924.1 hypothetical protein AsAng_0016340 [Aureispira anguillae]BDS10973.1 hypothetical protein AsAng_0016830 [Aureispira anguillae]BDS12348.1 hypothetical protein AsAng_0030690 [Aureispira anguillae]
MAKIKQTQIDEKYLWIGGGIVVILLVIFVLGRVSGKKSTDEPSDANPNIKPITVSTDSGNIDWNPSAMVKKVHTAYVVNWSTGRCEVLTQLLALQDVQIRAVADGYLQVYGKTLRKVLNEAWVACWNLPWQDDPHQQFIKRLDALQIT